MTDTDLIAFLAERLAEPVDWETIHPRLPVAACQALAAFREWQGITDGDDVPKLRKITAHTALCSRWATPPGECDCAVRHFYEEAGR